MYLAIEEPRQRDCYQVNEREMLEVEKQRYTPKHNKRIYIAQLDPFQQTQEKNAGPKALRTAIVRRWRLISRAYSR
jgi:hypothetical protein